MLKYHTVTDREYIYNKRSNIKCNNELSSEIKKKQNKILVLDAPW